MINTNAELSELVKRYEAELGCEYNLREKAELVAFAQFVQSQNLQQDDCSTLREFILQKMKGDILFADAQDETIFPTYYNGKIVAYQNVLQLIDELQPVA